MNGPEGQNVWFYCTIPTESLKYSHIVIAAKLPKWFGERPGKKSGEPESPDDEDEAGGDAVPGAVDEEEEEEGEEEEEEE